MTQRDEGRHDNVPTPLRYDIFPVSLSYDIIPVSLHLYLFAVDIVAKDEYTTRKLFFFSV